MDKKFLGRFEKDLQGMFTTLIFLGIIIEGKRLWTHQIKSRFEEITDNSINLPTSTLYATLNKLEQQYRVIYSDFDNKIKRKFYSATETGLESYNTVKIHFCGYYESFINTFNKLKID